MKTAIAIILALSLVGIGAYYAVQNRKASAQEVGAVQKLQSELQEKEQQLEQMRVEQEKAREQARQVAMTSDEIAAQARAREVALSNSLAGRVTMASAQSGSAAGADTRGGAMGKMISNLLKDPDMRSMVRDQQRTVMKQLYAPLERQLNLTQEESARFNDIMAANMDTAMESAVGMFGGSAEERAAALKKMSADQQASEAQMKELLGEDRFATYKDYQQTVGERAQLNSFRQSHSGITDEQSEALLTLMREEKQRVASSSGVAFPNQDPAQTQKMLEPGQIEKLLQAQETVNQNVLHRATEVLSPDQLDAFGRFQANQLQMMNMGLKMAGKLMGGESAEGAPAPAN